MDVDWNMCQALDGLCDRRTRYRTGTYCGQHQIMKRRGEPLLALKNKVMVEGQWNQCQALERGCGYKAQSPGAKYCKRHAEMNRQGRPFVAVTEVMKRPEQGWGECQALDGTCGREVATQGAGYCRTHKLQLDKGRPLAKIRIRRPNGSTPPACLFEGCDRPSVAIGLCSSHANHHYAGQELRPLTPRRANHSAIIRNDRGEKHCKECARWLDASEFTLDAAAIDGLFVICKSFTASKGVMNRFKLQPGQYVRMLKEQNGGCAICGATPADRRLGVDHDHKCCPANKSCGACVRGLLCDNCNKGIGNLRDDIAILEAAIGYLKKFKLTIPPPFKPE